MNEAEFGICPVQPLFHQVYRQTVGPVYVHIHYNFPVKDRKHKMSYSWCFCLVIIVELLLLTTSVDAGDTVLYKYDCK